MDGFGCSGSVMLLVYVEMDVWWSLVGRGIAEDSSLDEEPIGFGWKSSYEKGFARSGHLELSPCHCKDRSDHVLLLDQEWVGIKNRILLLWPCFGEQKVVKQGWLRAMSYPDWSRWSVGHMLMMKPPENLVAQTVRAWAMWVTRPLEKHMGMTRAVLRNHYWSKKRSSGWRNVDSGLPLRE